METVNNVASAAAKAVWGEKGAQQHGEEPVSGKTGDTSKGEPYDAGNLDEPNSTMNDPVGEKKQDVEFAKQTGTAAQSEDTPNDKSTEMKLRDAGNDSSKGQADTRTPEDPKTNPKSAPTDVNNTTEGPNEAQKTSAPGPKPLGELASKHGGDAGATGNAGGEAKKDEGEGDGPDAKSKGEGTGEQWVKTSGLKADGGDFDATKPGAGREADRLMEQKGMHPNEPDKGQGESGGDSSKDSSKDSGKDSGKSPSGGEKKGIASKIKDKLHRH
ncbi:hypothetical protein F4780DRAFT_481265 [Xylariomycetidae sp. FL0641]|nr:hypothetical protein F4780DRAFT_481265 [Xylariomycetidae sp. FL0641]